jgi:type VI secretion system protein ImpJ
MTSQHLQQQDRYHESLLSARMRALDPLSWGVLEQTLDAQALSAGEVLLRAFRGVMPDGTALDLAPGDSSLPASRPVGEHFPHNRSELGVYLALPREVEGADNFAEGTQAPTRYRAEARSVHDLVTGRDTAEIEFAAHRLSLVFDDEPLDDFVHLRIAEIVRDDAGGLVLSDPYVPPCLRIAASPFVMAGIRRLLQTMMTRHKSLSEARRQSSDASIEFNASDVTRFLLLSTINGFIPLLNHLAELGDVPPRPAYMVLTQLAGELTTFSPDTDPLSLPRLQHTNLRATFEELFARITALLQATVAEHYVSLPLTAREDGMHMAEMQDERLFGCERFLIAVKTDLPQPQVAQQLPALCKLASWRDVNNILSAATPGAAVRVEHRPPPEIPIKAGLSYFAVDTDNAFWRNVMAERNVAVYLPPFFDPAQTTVELMGVPRRSGS